MPLTAAKVWPTAFPALRRAVKRRSATIPAATMAGADAAPEQARVI